MVLIDKPQGHTSHDVVNRWRRLAGIKRVGHLGTLDPMATGLLVVMSGTATRLARFFERQDKTYQAEVLLGCVSDTYDIEGEVVQTGCAIPDASEILLALNRFSGPVWQTPPPVSAKKIKGTPAYKLARKGQPVDLAPVQVEIKSLEDQAVQADRLTFSVTCSAGTYIRSIAHDLGKTLECGALLAGLRRTASGTLFVQNARTLEELARLAGEDRLHEALLPVAQLLPEFPSAYVDAATEAHIRQGRDFRTSPFTVAPGAPFVKALSFQSELISIGELRFPNVYHPMIVL